MSLIIENLQKKYINPKNKTEVLALKNINISFNDKGLCFIVGRSGSGKTTFLNLISTIDTPSSGNIILCGHSYINSKNEDFEFIRNHYIGNIFQEYYLIPYYSVGENIKIALDLKESNIDDNEKHKQIEEILKKVSLVDGDGNTFYDRKISELSGGEKQRVAIARCLIKDPKIILADEPTGALDYETGKEILKLLKEISKDRLVIIVSHDEEFANLYGDRIIRFKDGETICDTNENTFNYVNSDTTLFENSEGNLKFKTFLRMGLEGFKHKKFRLVLTIIMLFLSLFFAGFLVTLLTSNISYASLKYAYRNNSYVYVEGYNKIINTHTHQPKEEKTDGYDPYSKKTKDILDYGCAPIIQVSNFNFVSSLNLSQSEISALCFDYNYNYFDNVLRMSVFPSNNAIEYNINLPLEPDDKFNDKEKCRYPETIYEIGITDIKAEAYYKFGFLNEDGTVSKINTPDDLIGKTIDGYTICGVFKTPESDTLLKNRLIQRKNESFSYFELSLKESDIKLLASYFIVCNDFMTKYAEEHKEEYLNYTKHVSRFFLAAKKGILKDEYFLKKLSFKEEDREYGVNASVIFSSQAESIKNSTEIIFVRAVLILLIIVFFILTVIELSSYLNVVVNRRKKEFGILLSIGFKSKKLKTIVLIESFILSVFVLFIFYFALIIFNHIINERIFIIPFLNLNIWTIVLGVFKEVLLWALRKYLEASE